MTGQEFLVEMKMTGQEFLVEMKMEGNEEWRLTGQQRLFVVKIGHQSLS